ncbi:hypothetical protein OIU84_027266 [Salix udensis]|uniref:NAC domain-containing protein n=1 Tax=Salix udensis TaxID=889485 RepID=A0AAD6PAP2_9ROSI|nr:hypothetical protein OIU84_027266 [Salix udensis]
MVMATSTGGVPPGFRFHPTDEELLHYYLKKKVSFQKFDMEVIREVDLNKMEPWELQEKCRIGSAPQNEWYLFCHKDRKYPTGSRTNRATNAGFWKATGRDKCIRNSYKKIGMRKTLVFYGGRAPHGQKTDWIMHEYRLEDGDDDPGNFGEDGWVVCRVFKKKNLFKVSSEGGSTSMNSSDQQVHSSSSNQSRTFMHRDSQYLLRQHHNHGNTHQQPYEAELELHYPPHMATPHQYSLFQSQTLLPTSKSLGYDYSGLHKESSAMVKQLMSNPRDCESGSESLRYHACEPGLEVCTCEAPQPMVAGREDHLGLNKWAMLDRVVTSHLGNEDSSKGVRFDDASNAPSTHPINQLSLREEMNFWGYGKIVV